MRTRLRTPFINLVLIFAFFLASCGGGSTVTAVSLEADANDVAVGGRTEVTARATDSITDNTLGEKVTFTIRHNESGSRLDVINDRLDGNGESKAIFHAGPREGTDIIEASFESGARTTTTIRVGGGIVIGNLRLEAFRAENGWRIRAIVTDTRGFPAAEVTVTFSATSGTLAPATTQTNNSGFAETLITNVGQSTATVFATVGGITESIRVGATEPAPPVSPATISLSQTGNQVFAFVRDSSGDPVNGQLVNFRISQGTITASTSTNPNGIATATVSDLAPGVQATVNAIAGTLSNSLTFTMP